MAISDVLESVRNVSALAAQEKGLTIVVDQATDTTAMVVGDPLRLKQVLSNLVSNAVKFTESGSVSVSVSRDGDDYRFEVKTRALALGRSKGRRFSNAFSKLMGRSPDALVALVSDWPSRESWSRRWVGRLIVVPRPELARLSGFRSRFHKQCNLARWGLIR